MLDLNEFLTESESSKNTRFGDLGEIVSVLAIHHSSSAAQKKYKSDKKYKEKIDTFNQIYTDIVNEFGQENELTKKAIDGGEACAKNWLKAATDKGIDVNNITNVYWTPKGIKEFFPSATQQSDPPDLLLFYTNNNVTRAAGVSLKVGKGITYGNEGAGAYDREIGTHAGAIWRDQQNKMIEALRKKLQSSKRTIAAEKKVLAGEKITTADLKELARKGYNVTKNHIKEFYGTTQEMVVQDFVKQFNSLTPEKRRNFLLDRFHANNKTTVDLYVASTTEAHSVDDMPIVQRLRSAQQLEAKDNGRNISIADEHGDIIMIEARSTHGFFNSNQFNMKTKGDKKSWNGWNDSQVVDVGAKAGEEPEEPETEPVEYSNEAPGTDQDWLAPSEIPKAKIEDVLPKSGFRLKAEEKPQETKPQPVKTKAEQPKKGTTQKPKNGKTVSRAMKAAKPKDQAPAVPRSRIHKHLAKIDLAALQRDYENPNVSMKQIETSYKLVPHAIARYAGAYAWKRPEKRVK